MTIMLINSRCVQHSPPLACWEVYLLSHGRLPRRSEVCRRSRRRAEGVAYRSTLGVMFQNSPLRWSRLIDRSDPRNAMRPDTEERRCTQYTPSEDVYNITQARRAAARHPSKTLGLSPHSTRSVWQQKPRASTFVGLLSQTHVTPTTS